MFDGDDRTPGLHFGDDSPGNIAESHSSDRGSNELDILYDKKFVCPLCNAAFTSKKIRSRFIKPIRLDSDFCQLFAPGDPNPLHHYIIVCPECSYGFYEDSSRIPLNVRDELARFLSDWRLSHTKSYCRERSLYDVIETYRLALVLGDLIHETHINRAGLNIRLAWLFREQQDAPSETRYLKEALQQYEQSYINSDFLKTNTTEMQILYMIGELHRRQKNYAEAIRYFGMVVYHEDRSRYRKFVNLARDQWTLAREEHKQENNGYSDLTSVADE